MAKAIKYLLIIVCTCAILATITGKKGAEFFVGIGMIALALLAVLVIIDLFKSV